MNIIDRFKKTAREAVDTASIFLSSHMLTFLKAKTSLICKAWKIAMPDIRVYFLKDWDLTACASLSEVHLNAAHEMFEGNDDARLLKVCGALLHEIGHIIFTNYTAWNSWMAHMKSGLYWPRVPEVAPDYEDSRDGLAKLASDERFKESFLQISHNLANCLEDGRIERFILMYVRNAVFMTKGLVRLRQETYAKCPTFEELASLVDSGKASSVMSTLQLVIHYARFGGIKGTVDSNHPLGAMIEKLIPHIDDYLEAKDAVTCYDAFNKMLVLMEEMIRSEFEQAAENAQSQQCPEGQQSQDGQGQDQSQSSSSSQGEGSNASSSSSPAGGNESGQTEGQTSSGNSGGESETGSDSSSGESTEGKDSNQSESGKDGESSSPSMSAAELAEAIKEQIRKELEKLVGTTNDNSENMSSQAEGSDRGSVGRKLSGLATQNGGKVNTPNAAEEAEGSGTITHETTTLASSDPGLTLEDIARKIADEEAEKMMSEELKREYSGIASSVKDYSNIHRFADITMYHYPEATPEEIRRYDEIAASIAPLVKRAVKSSNFYEKDREGVVKKHLYSGRVDTRSVHRQDGKMFRKTKSFEEPPQVALAVRVDCSGSMSGDRILAAQRCCIFLYEYALGMEKKYNVKIPMYIYGDCCRREASGVNMYVFADDKYRTPSEKYRLMKLAAGGCNRDGLPIRMAVKRLEEEYPRASKVVFNITDGQPNDYGYGGSEAFNDLRDITRHCERHKIALASCAIGDDRELIEEIYGSDHFLNISDLNELPLRLVRILKTLLK